MQKYVLKSDNNHRREIHFKKSLHLQNDLYYISSSSSSSSSSSRFYIKYVLYLDHKITSTTLEDITSIDIEKLISVIGTKVQFKRKLIEWRIAKACFHYIFNCF